MRLNLVLALLLLISLGGHFFVYDQPAQPNFEWMPEMVRSAAFESFSANPNFADGKTLQLPPEHTIARGSRVARYQATEADAVRAGAELANPVKPEDLQALNHGAARFQVFCVPCHGASGRGDGPVVMRGYPAPPPLHSEKTLALPEGRMFHIITFGQKNMPGYASQISEEDRWKIIAYARSLQRSMAAQAAAASAAAQPAPAPAQKPAGGAQ